MTKRNSSIGFRFRSFLVKSSETRNVEARWNLNELNEFYPGLIEPIRQTIDDPKSRRKIYLITPTKTRAEQFADLTRLAQTLFLVKPIDEIRQSHVRNVEDPESVLDRRGR